MSVLNLVEERFDKAIRFFLFVMIAMLPFSPAAVEICVSFSVVLWFAKRTWRLQSAIKSGSAGNKIFDKLKFYQPVDTPVNRSIAWFMLACFLSTVGSAYMADSLKACFSKIFEWFIIYFVILEVVTEKRHIKTIVALFCLSSLLIILDGLLQYYLLRKDLFLGRILNGDDRPTSAFKTPSDFGAYLTVCVPFIFMMLFNQWYKKNVFWFCLGASFFGWWALWIVEARAAWMGVVVALVLALVLKFYHWFVSKISARSRILWGFFILFAVAGVAFIFSRFLHHRISTVMWRKEVWESTVKMILDQPVFGHGVNTYMRVLKDYFFGAKFMPTYAHNSVLQTAAETGFFGVFWFLMVLGTLFYSSYVQLRRMTADAQYQIIGFGFLTGAFALFIQSLADTSFQSTQLSALFWFFSGTAVAIIKILQTR